MMKKISGFCLSIALLSPLSQASHVNRQRVEVRQPDGTPLVVEITGDEFHAKVESLDGLTLVKHPRTGWYDLATHNRDKSALVSSGIHYSPKVGKEIRARSRGIDLPAWKIKEIRNLGRTRRDRGLAKPRLSSLGFQGFAIAASAGTANDGYEGDILGLTLLVDFPDDPATHSPGLVDTVLNGEGYSRPNVENTVYDYFRSVSGGKLRYRNVVMDHYYRAPQPKAFYGEFANMEALLKDVLAHLDAQGMDFSRFTVGTDGHLRALNLFYAGGVAEYSVGLWPHAGVFDNGNFEADGVIVSRHTVTGLRHDFPYVGTFIHENGHMLMRWPDLYDPNGGGAGVGPYCIMGFDNWGAPQRPNPSLRLQAGWDEVIDIAAAPAGAQFTIGATANRIYRYQHPTKADESFLVDARPTRTRHWPHDHGGLAIWHVDRANWGNDQETMTEEAHYRVSLEQSNGLFNLESGQADGSQDFFFHSGTQAVFHDGTLPNARWWSGDESHLHLRAISGEPSPQGSMTFEMGAWPTLASHTLTTVTGGGQAEIIPLPAPCNLAHGAQGVTPGGGGNFGTVPRVGDRVFLNADGSGFAVPLTSASAWWLGFHWTTPYQGAGSLNGACSVLRGEGGTANGSFDPQGPLTVTTGRTQTIRFFPHAGHVIQDIRVDGVSVGAVTSYTLHNIGADHVIEADFTPGTLTYHLTVQGQNGPGTYVGTGDHPGATWVGIGATPGAGFKFDHWIITYGHATVENPLVNPTRVFLNSNAIVLAVYTQVQDQCGGIPDYQDGSSYATGDDVVNAGNRYDCLVGGWCSIGGPYAPGTGWAWENAWQLIGSCN